MAADEMAGEEKVVLGKRSWREGGKGPHHSLPHYRGEFDGVGSDIVEWMPYGDFDDMDLELDWEDYEARMSGLARVPLLHYEIVEYHHHDRLLR